MISTFRRVVLHIHFINVWWSEEIIGQMFLANDTMLNENEVALTGDLISNICWKGETSQ